MYSSILLSGQLTRTMCSCRYWFNGKSPGSSRELPCLCVRQAENLRCCIAPAIVHENLWPNIHSQFRLDLRTVVHPISCYSEQWSQTRSPNDALQPCFALRGGIPGWLNLLQRSWKSNLLSNGCSRKFAMQQQLAENQSNKERRIQCLKVYKGHCHT